MPTHPYLHFQGTCAQALAFYAEALGGTDLAVMRYGDTPDDAPQASGPVMHGQLRIGDGVLMASDFPPGTQGEAQKAVSVMQTFPDPGAARRAFERLSDGAAVIQDFGPTFFSPGFGMLRDRFGTHWILSADPVSSDQEPEAHPS